MAATLQIQLLGDLIVRVDGAPTGPARTRKDLWLLAYLALHRGEAQPRRRLIDRLWTELPADRGRDNLRHALSRLRRILGPGAVHLHSTGAALTLGQDAVVDVIDFTRLAVSPRLEDGIAALELWRGEPLTGIDQDWADHTRRDLNRRYRTLVARLVDGTAETHPGQALQWARLLAEIDPYADAACRRVMRLTAVQGHRADAVRHFHGFSARLRRDLDLEPEPATQMLYTDLHQGPVDLTGGQTPG